MNATRVNKAPRGELGWNEFLVIPRIPVYAPGVLGILLGIYSMAVPFRNNGSDMYMQRAHNPIVAVASEAFDQQALWNVLMIGVFVFGLSPMASSFAIRASLANARGGESFDKFVTQLVRRSVLGAARIIMAILLTICFLQATFFAAIVAWGNSLDAVGAFTVMLQVLAAWFLYSAMQEWIDTHDARKRNARAIGSLRARRQKRIECYRTRRRSKNQRKRARKRERRLRDLRRARRIVSTRRLAVRAPSEGKSFYKCTLALPTMTVLKIAGDAVLLVCVFSLIQSPKNPIPYGDLLFIAVTLSLATLLFAIVWRFVVYLIATVVTTRRLDGGSLFVVCIFITIALYVFYLVAGVIEVIGVDFLPGAFAVLVLIGFPLLIVALYSFGFRTYQNVKLAVRAEMDEEIIRREKFAREWKSAEREDDGSVR